MTLLTRNIKAIKGDAIDIQLAVGTDITGWEVRAEIWDSQTTPVSVKKANNIVSGGDSTQIEVTDAANGIFVIHILSGETTTMTGDVQIESEVEDTNARKTTILQSHLDLLDEKITWDDPTA